MRLPADRTLRVRLLVGASPGDVVAFVAEQERPRALDLAALSPRERQVARLIASGSTDAQVGRRLKIAVGTVRWHLTNIYRKTGLAGRSWLQAAGRAKRASRSPAPRAPRLAAARR